MGREMLEMEMNSFKASERWEVLVHDVGEVETNGFNMFSWGVFFLFLIGIFSVCVCVCFEGGGGGRYKEYKLWAWLLLEEREGGEDGVFWSFSNSLLLLYVLLINGILSFLKEKYIRVVVVVRVKKKVRFLRCCGRLFLLAQTKKKTNTAFLICLTWTVYNIN